VKKVAVTGAAGFLGSHLVKRLLEDEAIEVIGLDNLTTGQASNLAEVMGHGRFCFLQADVADPSLAQCRQWEGVTEIYHLASPASPQLYQRMSLETIAVNTTGTKQLLELADRLGAKLVFASTSEAYGDPEVHPQPETYRGNVNTWGPRACYDESKRLGEVLCYEYWTKRGVRVAVARIFNTYSAGLSNDDGRVISTFVNQALTGKDLTVFGDGSQTRSFCYVDDTAEGLIRLMEKPEADGEIINIGNPEEYTILEVARLVKELTGSVSRIVFLPLPEDDPKVRRPDICKAERLLGWKPRVGFREGLERTIAAYRAKLH